MQSNILVKGSQVLLTAKVNYGRNDLYVSAAAMDVNTASVIFCRLVREHHGIQRSLT